VDGYYVISLLCDLYGPGGWGHRILKQEVVQDQKDDKDRYRIGVSVHVELTVDGSDHPKHGIGYGEGIDRWRGAAYESASKEAETDAIKRAAKNLGNRAGLSLYRNGPAPQPSQPRERKETREVPADAAAHLSELSEKSDLKNWWDSYAKGKAGGEKRALWELFKAQCAAHNIDPKEAAE